MRSLACLRIRLAGFESLRAVHLWGYTEREYCVFRSLLETPLELKTNQVARLKFIGCLCARDRRAGSGAGLDRIGARDR